MRERYRCSRSQWDWQSSQRWSTERGASSPYWRHPRVCSRGGEGRCGRGAAGSRGRGWPALAVVGAQGIDIGGATLGVADAVDVEGDVGEAKLGYETPSDLYYLGIHGRVGVAEDFEAELVVFAVAACLGTLVAEDGAEIVEADGLGEVVHAVFEVGAAYGGGAFGAEGEEVAAAVGEGVGLLLDDVGACADGAVEEAGAFEDGSVEAGEAVLLAQSDAGALDMTPVLLLLGEEVGGPSRSPELQVAFSQGKAVELE